ncbi:MAG TPA: amidohydrolase family protein [Vicinamibacterales bacterium]
MTHLLVRVAVVLAVVSVWAVSARQASEPLAFVNVNVVPMDSERVLARQTVVVQQDRIVAVGPADKVQVPAGAKRIDAAGKYLMPGLAEMHGHLGSQEEMNLRILELNVLKGITTIRSMLGHPSHLPLRERVRKGEVLGPAIYTSGPSFNGNSAKTPEAAVQMVKEQKAAGYDFLKMHPGVPLASFEALVKAGREVGIMPQGHVPAEVGLARALAAPYPAIDHLDGYVEALAGWTPGPNAPDPGFFGFKVADKADESRIASLVAETRKAKTVMVPTETVIHTFFSEEAPEKTVEQPQMRYVPKALRDNWVKQKTGFNDSHGLGTPEQRKHFFELRRRLIKALHDGGVPILLGADSPQVFSVPGFATHQELAHLVAAGLTPYQALAAGTKNVAAFLETDGGTVEQGKRADLVLLEANPLERVENASRIAGVVVGGRWIGPEEIASRLKALETP